MLDDIPRVVLGAVDERRLAAAEHRQADGVEAGAGESRRHAATGLGVDHRYVEPAIVGLKPVAQDDRADLAAREMRDSRGA